MFLSDPVKNLRLALLFATVCDLTPVPAGASSHRCPRISECKVYLFQQAWDTPPWLLDAAAAISHDSFMADTVVVIGPQGDACVYLGDELAYRVAAADRCEAFQADLSAHQLASFKKASNRYTLMPTCELISDVQEDSLRAAA